MNDERNSKYIAQMPRRSQVKLREHSEEICPFFKVRITVVSLSRHGCEN
jgi:hypothetical protein